MALLRTIKGKLAEANPAPRFEPELWRRRLATLAGGVLVGLVALGFAHFGDLAQRTFSQMQARVWWFPLIWTPALFILFAAVTIRMVPEARGSGIPQVIAATHAPDSANARRLLSLRVAFSKLFLTVGALFAGGSVGREGPTVQVAAAIMARVHKWLRVPLGPGVMIAGGAAGVSAAFNTPVAGIAFAIEELAVAYEQRVALLVMAAVMISGLTAQGLAGDYVYFGTMASSLPVTTVIIAAPLCGIVGGIAGGLFSRSLLALRGPGSRFAAKLGRRPLLTALACGLVVAGLGIVTGGLTWGTGYEPTRHLLEGGDGPLWFGPAKLAATLATAASGIPGGIFAPSLAVGAGFGEMLAPLFKPEEAGAIVLLGMVGYFVGVVRAPLTAVIILVETTGSASAILPLFATALIGDWAGSMVCKQRLYHALARTFKQPVKDADEAKVNPPA